MGPRISLAGHEGGTPDTDKGRPYGLPRQLSTLPGKMSVSTASCLVTVSYTHLTLPTTPYV